MTFDASKSTGEIVSYQWTVLDEEGEEVATGNEEQFSYEFYYGRYFVRLEITTFELETDEAQVEVVANKPPVAAISPAPPYPVAVGEEVTFSANGSDDPDGSIDEYLWDFGDGVRGSTQEPQAVHEYEEDSLEGANNKTFTVTLVVVDELGGISEPVFCDVTVVGGCGSCGR